MRQIRGRAIGLMGLLLTLGLAQEPADVYMTNLTIAANVFVETGRVAAPGFDANTRFEINAAVNWRFETSYQKKGDVVDLIVYPSITRADVKVQHFMLVPKSGDHDYRLFQNLMLHEYDHVAVSNDGRAKALLTGLLRDMPPFQKPWNGMIPPPADAVNALIRAEVDARKQAVVKLVLNAYEKLDKASNHGRQLIENRAELFQYVYSSQHLKDAKFTYAEEAQRIAASPAYSTAKRYYRL